MKKRKNLTLLILFILIFILAACVFVKCSGKSSDNDKDSSEKNKTEDVRSDEDNEEDYYKESALSKQELPDPDEFVGKAKIGSAGGKKGIHSSKWTPRTKAPWICVARANDPAMRLRIAKAMKQAIKLDNVKYSGKKEKRVTFYEEASDVNFDLPEVTAECYTSCTSVASVCLRAAGFSKKVAPKLVYSDSKSPKTNLRKHLKELDTIFTCYETEDYTADSSRLQPGDILFSEHHVAVVIRSENIIKLDE